MIGAVDEMLAEATVRLREAGIASPRLEARLLLTHAEGASDRFEALLARRLAREPLAYITGAKEFWSLEFAVGPGVLVPRPESETLVEAALRDFAERTAPLRVLDLGTGSGCLLLSFLSERPNATGVGIDASHRALSWAAENAERLGLADRTAFRTGDWADGVNDLFTVMFVNPPYVREDELDVLEPEVARAEPRIALAGGEDGLAAYRAFVPELGARLTPNGLAFLEIGAGQAPGVRAILEAAGMEVARIVPDLAGIPRCVVARGGVGGSKKELERAREAASVRGRGDAG